MIKNIELDYFLHVKRENARLKKLRRGRKKKKRIKRKYWDRKIVQLPVELDFYKSPDLVLDLLQEIQNAIMDDGKSFIIDHSRLELITTETLVLLTAEIERSLRIRERKVNERMYIFDGKSRPLKKLNIIKKFMPKNHQIMHLLDDIGYWNYFTQRRKINHKNIAKDVYLRITSDNTVNGKKLAELIEFFEQEVTFSPKAREKFSDAIQEAAGNTVEHAYNNKKQKNNLKKWWLTASLNKENKEISVVFYDQGAGILNTLTEGNDEIDYQITNNRFKKFIKKYLALYGLSDKEILRKLVTTNLSKHKGDSRRGNGLISFKTFIDEVKKGELSVSTSNITYKAKKDVIFENSRSIEGTLIVWTICVKDINSEVISLKEQK